MIYFLDTYAMVEIMQGNARFQRYLDSECKTSIFNLYELVYNVIRENEQVALESFNSFLKFSIEIENEWLVEAARFKLKYRSRNVSYADCIGYVISLKTGMLFLTGDKEFKDFPNVEFVK